MASRGIGGIYGELDFETIIVNLGTFSIGPATGWVGRLR